MLFNLAMRHPWDPGRPLVDLDLALVLTPALLLGVSIGAHGLVLAIAGGAGRRGLRMRLWFEASRAAHAPAACVHTTLLIGALLLAHNRPDPPHPTTQPLPAPSCLPQACS